MIYALLAIWFILGCGAGAVVGFWYSQRALEKQEDEAFEARYLNNMHG